MLLKLLHNLSVGNQSSIVDGNTSVSSQRMREFFQVLVLHGQTIDLDRQCSQLVVIQHPGESTSDTSREKTNTHLPIVVNIEVIVPNGLDVEIPLLMNEEVEIGEGILHVV